MAPYPAERNQRMGSHSTDQNGAATRSSTVAGQNGAASGSNTVAGERSRDRQLQHGRRAERSREWQ